MKKLVFAIALLVFPCVAQAVPITGSVTLSQSLLVCPNADCVLPVTGSGTVTTLTNAVALDFTSSGVPTPNIVGPMSIDGGTGTFAGIVGTGTIQDFCFVPGSCGIYSSQPNAFWQTSAGGASFDLLSVTTPFKSVDALTLVGTGLFRIPGFDNTPGTFSMAVTNAGTAFSFSATETAKPIPEPASLVLFGLGMIGVARRVRLRP